MTSQALVEPRPLPPQVEEVRGILRDLGQVLDRNDIGAADRGLLTQAERDVLDLFRLVVLGEFNAGKSAVLNGLLGGNFLDVGATPTTQVINLLRYADQPYARAVDNQLLERGLPVGWLRDMSLVDTPGTNAIIREHERITNEFVPRADLVLFITSSDRPFTESERGFLERIRDWGKNVVLVLNKVDLLNEAELATVIDFIKTNARALLALEPQLFPVSARLARASREATDEAAQKVLLEQSGFPKLQRHIFETLDDAERLRIKLRSPLGVAGKLIDTYQAQVAAQQGMLAEDVRTLEAIDRQAAAFQDEVNKDLPTRINAIDTVIHRLNERGDRFFQETVRIGRITDLIRPSRIREEFEREVVGATAAEIDREVSSLVDWLVSREGRFWTDAVEYLERRRQTDDDRLLGRVGGAFVERRRDLLGVVGESSKRVVEGFDRERQSDQLAHTFRDAVAQTALAQVGAVSLGALIAILVGTAAADVTGVVAAGVLGGLALFILPIRRSQAQKAFRERTSALRERLDAVVREAVATELMQAEERLKQAIAPFSRFVTSERERLADLTRDLNSIEQRIASLSRTLVTPLSSS